jgi:amidase
MKLIPRVLLVVVLGIAAAPGPLTAQRTIDLDAATIATVNAAFAKGTLTAERLVQMFLARIQAFDRQEPMLRSIITVNPKALDLARALDAERQSKGPRSVLHGIPIVIKDNIDTADLPTTGGSLLLEGSVPPDDAFVVRKLRAAGAIIIAKANLSEFASSAADSSLGGPIRNPHDLSRVPGGSSGGTGVSLAAAFAMAGLGTDTGGSVRNPSTANGIAGLKTTMARHIEDVAAVLGVIAGVDPSDAATTLGEGRAEADYTRSLSVDALRGARLGIARDFVGFDTDVDWVVDTAASVMRKHGATIIDVRLPRWLLDAKSDYYLSIRNPEFAAQIADYLRTLDGKYPKSLDELLERARLINAPGRDGRGPNPARWSMMLRESASGTTSDAQYLAVRDHAMPLVRAILDAVLTSNRLDAIVYPTNPRRPQLASTPAPAVGGGGADSGGNLANLSGFPDLIVPAGFSSDDLPIGLSFLGPAFSESRLLALGYSFEQATKARRLPVHTPLRTGESIVVP